MTQGGRKVHRLLTRRRFLASSGAAAAVLVNGRLMRRGIPAGTGAASTLPRDHTFSVFLNHGSSSVLTATVQGGTSSMGRMFPMLPSHNPDDQALVNLAATIPDFPDKNPDNRAIPAGFTFFGQFIDHDLTFDQVSNMLGSNDPNTMESSRTARAELDSLYGKGPAGSPQLYDPNDGDILLLVAPNGVPDVPRDSAGIAVIADPRNDQHKILTQLTVAFAKFHNAVVDHLRAQGTPAETIFDRAQETVRWHYQWVVIHDYLPRICGQNVVDSVLVTDAAGLPVVVTKYFHSTSDNAYIPVEFSVAAFRFGHTQVRHAYRINSFRSQVPILDGTDGLIGGSPITAKQRIDWGNFFNVASGTSSPQPSKLIDGKISLPLKQLPRSTLAQNATIRNLAERNLRRAKSFGLPSGQKVAEFMGADVLTNAQLGLPDTGFGGEAPLWFYILKEAELQQSGRRLGQIGSRIVAEVVLGLMAADSTSYLSRDPGFAPAPPIAQGTGTFTMPDLLRFAGVA